MLRPKVHPNSCSELLPADPVFKLGFREGKQLAYGYPPWDSIQLSNMTTTGYCESFDGL